MKISIMWKKRKVMKMAWKYEWKQWRQQIIGGVAKNNEESVK